MTIVDPSPRDPRKACNAAKVAGVLTIGEELVYGVFPEGGEMSCFEGDGVEGLIEGVEKEEKNDEVVEAGLEAYV